MSGRRGPRVTRVGLLLLLLCGGAWADEIDEQVAALDARTYRERQAASAALRAMGPRIAQRLQKAWKATASPEVKKRLEVLLAGWGRLADPAREKQLLPHVTLLRGKDLKKRLAAVDKLIASGTYGMQLLRLALNTPPPKFAIGGPTLLVQPARPFSLTLRATNIGKHGAWISQMLYLPRQYHRPLAREGVRGQYSISGGMFGVTTRIGGDWQRQLKRWLREAHYVAPGAHLDWKRSGTVAHVGCWAVTLGRIRLRPEAVWDTPSGPLKFVCHRPNAWSRQVIALQPGGRSTAGRSLRVSAPAVLRAGTTVVLTLTLAATEASTVNLASNKSSPFWYVLAAGDTVRAYDSLHAPEKSAPAHPEKQKPSQFLQAPIAGGATRTLTLALRLPKQPGKYQLTVGWYPTATMPLNQKKAGDLVHSAPLELTVTR